MYPPKCTSIHTHTNKHTHIQQQQTTYRFCWNTCMISYERIRLTGWSIEKKIIDSMMQNVPAVFSTILDIYWLDEYFDKNLIGFLFVLEEFMFVSKLGYQCRINSVLKLYQPTPCKDKCTSIRRNLQNDTKYTFQSFMSQPLNFSLADQQVSLKRFILD